MTLRRPDRRRVSSQRVNFSPKVDIPAPVGGLNTRDNRGDMEISDAIILENWIPANQAVQARKGYSVWTDDLTGEIESLLVYLNGTTSQMLATVGGEIYELGQTPLSSSTLRASSKTNDRWQQTMFNKFLLIVNGDDAPLAWDGSTFTTLSYTGDIITPTAASMDGIHGHKNRVYMWDTESSDFFYGTTDARDGQFDIFPLGVVSETGGNITLMSTLSLDAGSGLDDIAVFVLSTGETILYSGSDPSDATNWTLIGRYMLPPPIGVRSAVKFGGDVRIITEADTISIMEFIRSEGTQAATKRLSKISGSIKTEADLHKTKFGWQTLWHSAADLIIYNVPNIVNTTYVQYVTNTSTGASTKFTGWNARTIAIWDEQLFFSGDGEVYLAFDTLADNGTDINLVAQTAFTTLGISDNKKIITYEQLLGSDGLLNIGLSVAFNYGDTLTPSISSSVVSGAQWDTVFWDQFFWAGAGEVRVKRFVVSGSGLAISAKTTIQTQGQNVTWFRSTYAFDRMIVR